MNPLHKATLLCVAAGVSMIALQAVFAIQTGIAGTFVMGMAGGLFIASAMTRTTARKAIA